MQKPTQDPLHRVAAAIKALAAGAIVLVTDDDDREGEGDLVVAASHVTPEKMAFFIRHTSGIICAPLTRAEAKRLNLPPMVADNDSPQTTAFTVSVDFKHGMTTGISAEERANTVRALANPNAGPADFVRPGHVFPLLAREGGVLIRSGHTEASVDLCRLAGLPEVAAIGELMSDDGTVMRGATVAAFAERHKLAVVSVAELIAWRQRTERLITRVAETRVMTPAGPARAITYATPFDPMHHVAMVFGDIGSGKAVPVRLQLENVVGDVFGGGEAMRGLMARMTAAGRGVVVYLREGAVGVAGRSADAEDHASARGRAREWREVGLGAQILVDLGVRSIRLIASREWHYVGLAGFGIAIESTETGD